MTPSTGGARPAESGGPEPSLDGPPFVVEYAISEGLAARMLRAYLVRRMGGWAIGAGLAAAFALWGVWRPSIRVPSAFALGLATMLAVAWLRAWRGALRQARRRAGETVRFVFDDEAIEWSGQGSAARVAWSDLRRIDRTRDFWFLQFDGEGRSAPVPAEALAEPVRRFVEECARRARARID